MGRHETVPAISDLRIQRDQITLSLLSIAESNKRARLQASVAEPSRSNCFAQNNRSAKAVKHFLFRVRPDFCHGRESKEFGDQVRCSGYMLRLVVSAVATNVMPVRCNSDVPISLTCLIEVSNCPDHGTCHGRVERIWGSIAIRPNWTERANLGVTEPPQLNWSTVMFRKRRTENVKQATEARRDCLEVTAG